MVWGASYLVVLITHEHQIVIYSAGFWVTIERLTPDFLGVTGEMFDGFRDDPAEWGVEAPLMFKRRGLYFILFGPFCCFCYQVFVRAYE